jgi:hypothetical protein
MPSILNVTILNAAKMIAFLLFNLQSTKKR